MPIIIILVALLIYAFIRIGEDGLNSDMVAKIILVVLAIAALITLAYAPIAFLIMVAVIIVAVIIWNFGKKNQSSTKVDENATVDESIEETILDKTDADCAGVNSMDKINDANTTSIGVNNSEIETRANATNKQTVIFDDTPPSSFQYDLLKNLRTKEDVQAAELSEMRKEAMQYALDIYEEVKRRLINDVNNGKYEIIDGKKVVISIIPLQDESRLNWLKCQKNTIDLNQNISGIRNYQDVEYCYRFVINTSLESFTGCVMKYLFELAKADNIAIKFCAWNRYYSKDYPINTDISGDYISSEYGYRLSAKVTSLIPNTYSNKQVHTSNIPSDIEQASVVIDYDIMEGHDFEKFCAELLRKNGYTNVIVTKGSGDQGIDIIAYKDSVKFGIQCKCYSSDIGNKAVQEAFAGKTYYDCHVGVVLANRYFTSSAIELAKRNGILLWDRDRLNALIENTKK